MAKNPFDDLVQKAAERMAAIVDNAPNDVEPFGTKRLSRREQYERYMTEVRDNPQAWMQIIQEHGLKGAVDYWKQMEVRNGRPD